MSLAVTELTAAYAALAILLLSLNLTSLWRWWVKAAAIVVTIAFFGVTYHSVIGLLGWPTVQRMPARFSLVSSRIAEPDRRTNSPGHIYLWADALDESNVPSGRPRSYELAYTTALARKVNEAQEKRDRGLEVMGVAADRDTDPSAEPGGERKGGKMQKQSGDQAAAPDAAALREDASNLSFEDLPPVLLPDKGPP